MSHSTKLKTSGEVLFVCASANQARLLADVGQRETGFRHSFISLDSFVEDSRFESTPTLHELGVESESLPFSDPAKDRHFLAGPLVYRTKLRSDCKHFLVERRPAAIVVANDTTFCNRQLIRAANALSIPSLLVQDGLIVDRSGGAASRSLRQNLRTTFFRTTDLAGLDFGFGTPFRYGTRGCTLVAVMSQRVAKKLIQQGVPKDSIRVTGFPLAWTWRQKASEDLPREVADLKEPWVLLAHQPLSLTTQQEGQLLHQLAASCFGLGHRLVVKLHPSVEDASPLREALAHLGTQNLTLIQQGDTRALLRKCAALLTCYSTMALEALANDVVVGLLRYFPSTYALDLGDGALALESSHSVAKDLDSLLHDTSLRDQLRLSAKDVLEAECGPLDHQAGDRVAQLVQELARTKTGEK